MKYTGDECEEPDYTRMLGYTDSYIGMWGKNKEGFTRWTGEGEVSFSNGWKLSGTFEDNKPIEGSEVTILLSNVNKHKTVWKNAETCIGNCQNGIGTAYGIKGVTWEGQFSNGRLNAKCKIIQFKTIEEGICQNNYLISGMIKCDKRYTSFCNEQLDQHLNSHSLYGSLRPKKEAIKLVLVDKLE